MIHAAIMGSLERFLSIAIEHFAGAFPVWLSPVQAIVLPVSDKFSGYAKAIIEELKEKDIRVELGDPNETLGKRIRESEMKKIPYILVVGEKEETSQTVSIRHYHRGQEGTLGLEDLKIKILEEINDRK
jgi:threonyl-tRNA synthetase